MDCTLPGKCLIDERRKKLNMITQFIQNMITQFVLKSIVDLVLVREPLEDLNKHLWRTQMALTNIMGQTKDLQFWRHNGSCSRPMMVVEAAFMVIEHFV